MATEPGKSALRLEVRARLALLRATPDLITRAGGTASALLSRTPEYERAAGVLVFLSTPDEIDTSPLAESALAAGKRVFAPRVDWQSGSMKPVEIGSMRDDTRPGPKGVRQPIGDRATPIAEIDFVLVPGIAFDPSGGRLGRGGGFYDRFLSQPGWRAVFCGFALEAQVVAEVPREPHDVLMHMLVTDASVRRFSSEP